MMKQSRTNHSAARNSCLSSRQAYSAFERGFTLIEIIVVIVILCIVSGITIKFLFDSMRIYKMTVDQKALFDEGKLAIERICRDIHDAHTVIWPDATHPDTIRMTRTNTTVFDTGLPNPGETLIFQRNTGTNTLEKDKESPDITVTMADHVSAFVAANSANEIQIQVTFDLSTGENFALQTKVYPKNLLYSTTRKNFFYCWKEVHS
jgi:prepilin-type N-terminal cleavage/methylation domain-containing protein